MKEDINEEWESTKMCIQRSAIEALGRKRKFRKRKGLRIWNEEIENMIKEKKLLTINTYTRKS